MEMIPGKLYEAIEDFSMMLADYHAAHREWDIKRGMVLMFLRYQSDFVEEDSYLVFLHDGNLLIGTDFDIDKFPEKYLKRAK